MHNRDCFVIAYAGLFTPKIKEYEKQAQNDCVV